mmetsp:Transcript_62860/g.71163  ORF Transcript_62860/g.71163 Transcript_62860/m.71163 type:complete len:255 (+) Transcript_62860:85-849(+)
MEKMVAQQESSKNKNAEIRCPQLTINANAKNRKFIISASRNNDGTEEVTNMETNTVTTKDEEINEEVAGLEAEANSDNSNNSNNGIGRSDSKSYYVEGIKKKKKGTTKKSNDDGMENKTTMESNTVTITTNNNNNNKEGNSTNKKKNSINAIARKWKTKQSVEEQEGEKDIQKHVDKYEAACDKIKQQYDKVYKSLETARGRRIKAAKFVKLQNVKSACDVLEQSITTRKITKVQQVKSEIRKHQELNNKEYDS